MITNRAKFFGSVQWDDLSKQHDANITHMVTETDRLLRVLDHQDKAGYIKQARDHLELAHIYSRKAIAFNQIQRRTAQENADGEISKATTLAPAKDISSTPTNPEAEGDQS